MAVNHGDGRGDIGRDGCNVVRFDSMGVDKELDQWSGCTNYGRLPGSLPRDHSFFWNQRTFLAWDAPFLLPPSSTDSYAESSATHYTENQADIIAAAHHHHK
eukprot:scaffold125874_cov36-Cyclotella_meneghiniana.AAC.1